MFGWPAAFGAIVAFAVAIGLRRPRWGVAAVILAAPFCTYVAGFPDIRAVALIVLILNACAALALWRGRILLGVGLFAPFVMMVGILATAVAWAD